MRGQLNSLHTILLTAVLIASAGCAGSHTSSSRDTTTVHHVPEISATKGTLKIDVVYPQEGAVRPTVASNFIFGSVGSGTAQLLIDDVSVPVAKNGAFLAYLPMPASGYTLRAHDGAQNDSVFVAFGAKEGGSQSDAGSIGGKKVTNPILPLPQPMMATIVTGRDTLATGSDVTAASPEEGADRKWQWPRGTRVEVVAKSGSDYEVKLSNTENAWVPDSSVRLDSRAEHEVVMKHLRLEPKLTYEDVILDAQWGAFLIEGEGERLTITLYHRRNEEEKVLLHPDALIAGITTIAHETNVVATVKLTQALWGYKAFFNAAGELVVRIRRGPTLVAAEPLRGVRVMIDPGHPPGGAIGPTRLTEADANLAIGLRVRDKLLEKGAIVEMTRTTFEGIRSTTVQSTELWARVDSAVEGEADVLVSIHNNGFPDGVDPFVNYGTSTYYFNDFSEPLATDLDREITSVTGIPNLGAHKRSLAMVRPTWMPSVLTESLYMMLPEEEAALRDPVFLDRLADAHVRGIEEFLASRISKP